MKETSLLRRFRWPLFILTWGAAQLAGTAWYYKDTHMALIGFVAFIVFGCTAATLNWIDETNENDRSRDNVMGEIMPPQEETEGGMG